MRHVTIIATCVLTLGIVPGVHAEPIQITDGSLTGRLIVNMDLRSSERGFMLTGTGDWISGLFAPTRCMPCAPGSLQSLDASFSGSGLQGGFSIDGASYLFGQNVFGASGSLFFSGSWVAPVFSGQTGVNVANPFTFSGLLNYPAMVGLAPEQLIGEGLATVTLNWLPGVNAWQFGGASYTFAAPQDIDPIPEPGTIALVGAGLGLLARRARRRGTT